MRRFVFLLVFLCGCTSKTEDHPKFALAWSEYPSWSVFGVARDKGILTAAEKKYGIEIVLKEADYDTCITLFGSGTVDASCQTNIDSLAPCLGRDSVVIMPSSTSVGADACIGVGFDGGIEDFLSKNTTYGLEKSVSQYVFERNLELLGIKKCPFRNMDPAAAAQAMQTNQARIKSIMVWNPFVLQTLRTNKDTKVLFDSSIIPEEVIDCIVVSKETLNKPGGKQFALAIIETYYEVCKLMNDPTQSDATYVALGAKFSNLNAADMKIVCQQTRFYNTPDKALALMESKKFQNDTMPMIVDWCLSHQMTKQKPNVGFGKNDAQLNFDTTYLKEYKK
jgi:ABC-type nitrate/sulfonate/bicarbonate transport system substrate-binding protein